jgi:hypothetical protein
VAHFREACSGATHSVDWRTPFFRPVWMLNEFPT